MVGVFLATGDLRDRKRQYGGTRRCSSSLYTHTHSVRRDPSFQSRVYEWTNGDLKMELELKGLKV